MHASPSFFGTAGEPVPPVDAEDLQTAYEILTDPARRSAGGASAGFSIDRFRRFCKAGADIPAVTYRAMMLQLLTTIAREQIAPLMKEDGRFDALVYREFAGFAMTWLPLRSTREGMPFDVDGFLSRVGVGRGQ